MIELLKTILSLGKEMVDNPFFLIGFICIGIPYFAHCLTKFSLQIAQVPPNDLLKEKKIESLKFALWAKISPVFCIALFVVLSSIKDIISLV